MYMVINVLSEDVINKIAAGEVIERPASVVKELLENSIDAGADLININIENYGKDLIRISDNGLGMNHEDAKKSIVRHATSKIFTADDLFAINSLGFRGEALASIAAISKMTIITKQKDEEEGYKIFVEGGNLIDSTIAAANNGTVIEVKDLFFSTPVRKKFLKSDAVELKHIIEVVSRYAVINPNITINLVHNGKDILKAPKVSDWRSRIASLYSASLAKDLLDIEYEDELIKIKGFIGKPHQSRNDKQHQSLFVNKRWVKSDILSKAVFDGYHSLIFVGKFPIFFIDLEINPNKVDVNVHPQKLEIKIEKKDQIYRIVMNVIKDILKQNNLIPTMNLNFEQTVINNKPKYNFEPSKQTVLYVKDQKPVQETVIIEEENQNYIENSIKLPPMKLLGQIHKTFFVAETPGGLLVIDQHVVQERALYEKFMNQYMNKNVAIQTLLKGDLIELDYHEKHIVEENLAMICNFGFNLEPFGEGKYVLKTIPQIFGRTQPKELLYELISSLKEGKNKIEEIQEDIITRMSCRASVKAGDTLTIAQMEKLLFELSQAKLPYHCPHGRSIFVNVNIDELEKKFKRKG